MVLFGLIIGFFAEPTQTRPVNRPETTTAEIPQEKTATAETEA